MFQEFLSELIISRHEKRDSQLQELNEMPLYPTEVRKGVNKTLYLTEIFDIFTNDQG